MRRVVIVGNGPAAHRLAERLTQHGAESTVTVLGAEPRPAYNRVLLSSVLDGTLPAEAVRLPDPPPGVRVRLGVTVTGIDRERRLVHTGTGDVCGYDELVLATGADPRAPALPGLLDGSGCTTRGVTFFRTLDDCEQIIRLAGSGGRVAVLGGGLLGVEAARGLAGQGLRVSLVHPAQYPMDRQLDPVAGQVLAEQLRTGGIDLRLGCKAIGYRPGRLGLDDGGALAIEALVVCTGVRPRVELAEYAGLTVRHGIVVDDRLRTDDPHIHAIGDCAEHRGDVPGLIAPAWEQAEILARLLTCADPRARYTGTRNVTRLKARGIDLATVGSAQTFEQATCTDRTEVVTLSDPARGQYARLAVRSDRVAAAVLLGFPQAAATITQLHDRDLPLPADRLGLLLGSAPAGPAPGAELPDEAVICRCNNVTKHELVEAWRGGARSSEELAGATRATTGCGGCGAEVERLCSWLRERNPAAESTVMVEKEGAA